MLLCPAVAKEFRERDDEVGAWVQEHFPPDAMLAVTEETIACYSKTIAWAIDRKDPPFSTIALSDYAKDSRADAWLVAHAAEHGLTILTNEKASARKTNAVKIPDAAAAQRVQCLSALELLREHGLRF
nr:DUF4411 family protein [Corynebacterium phocae]